MDSRDRKRACRVAEGSALGLSPKMSGLVDDEAEVSGSDSDERSPVEGQPLQEVSLKARVVHLESWRGSATQFIYKAIDWMLPRANKAEARGLAQEMGALQLLDKQEQILKETEKLEARLQIMSLVRSSFASSSSFTSAKAVTDANHPQTAGRCAS